MDSHIIPPLLPIPIESARALSLECWRLNQAVELLKGTNGAPGLRHAVRRITEVLATMDIEIIDFSGRAYDPGMVPEVVEVREDAATPAGAERIDETIAPTVIWRGQVLSPGKLIVRRAPLASESTEVGK